MAASEGKEGDPPSMVELQFFINPERYPHGMSFEGATAIADVKLAVGRELKIEPDIIKLWFDRGDGEVTLTDAQTLLDYGFGPGPTHDVELSIEIKHESEAEAYRMPGEIEVVIDYDGDVPSKKIRVEIQRDLQRKLYIGGYRNRKTALVYHHATTQTARDMREQQEGRPEKFHRDSQTVVESTRSAQTLRESGTQMVQRGLMIDARSDRVLEPRPYFDSAQLHRLKLKSTIVLQRYWRGFKARARAAEVRHALESRRHALAAAEEAKQADAAAQHKREIERRMHPRRFADFEILYNELENWRQHETTRINSSDLDESERLSALADLLHKETKLLQTIDRLKLSASKENRAERIKSMLSLMAAPKKWQMSDGDVAEVHTPFTTRAKELLELFNGLNLQQLTIDERLDVLLHVKWTVKEFDCNLTREIVDLIDREADLLNRGRKEKAMEGLRRRIANLFLQFIETPEFNPEAARFQKVPRDLAQRPNVRPR